jgi:hypothetical protein
MEVIIKFTEGEARFIQQLLGTVTVPAISQKRDAIVALIQRIESDIKLATETPEKRG